MTVVTVVMIAVMTTSVVPMRPRTPRFKSNSVRGSDSNRIPPPSLPIQPAILLDPPFDDSIPVVSRCVERMAGGNGERTKQGTIDVRVTSDLKSPLFWSETARIILYSYCGGV